MPINLLSALQSNPQQTWAEHGWLPSLLALLQATPPVPPGPDTIQQPVEEAYRQGIHQMGQGAPVSASAYIAALGRLAGDILGARGGFGAPPLSKVMEGGKPKQVYHGTPTAYTEMSAAKAGRGGGGDLYGPSPGGYWTESPAVAGGYAQGRSPLRTEEGVYRVRRAVHEWRQQARRYHQEYEKTKDSRYLVEERRVQSQIDRFRHQLQNIPGPNIRPAFLDITRPFDIDAPVARDVVRGAFAFYRQRFPHGDPSWIVEQAGIKGWTNNDLYQSLSRRNFTGKDIKTILEIAGYDGITHMGHGGARQWIPFRADQIVNPYQYLQSLNPRIMENLP